jgi:hypothetical protein
VSYQSDDENRIIFTLGQPNGALGNTAPPETQERITILGSDGQLFTSSASPKVWVSWKEGAYLYQMFAFGDKVNRDEVIHIAESLAPVIVAGAIPQRAPTAQAAAQQPDIWAYVRSVVPMDVPIYKPTFVPERFGAPRVLEARVDERDGPR